MYDNFYSLVLFHMFFLSYFKYIFIIFNCLCICLCAWQVCAGRYMQRPEDCNRPLELVVQGVVS